MEESCRNDSLLDQLVSSRWTPGSEAFPWGSSPSRASLLNRLLEFSLLLSQAAFVLSLLRRQLFKRCPDPSRVPGKAWKLHVIVRGELLLWNNRFLSPRRDPDCSHHNGIISSSKNLFLDLVCDLPGNPRSLSALLVTVLSTGGWMEAVN